MTDGAAVREEGRAHAAPQDRRRHARLRRSRACSSTPRSTSGTPAKAPARQNSTNPCSEYLFLDNTACNLASLNLLKFKKADGSFDVERFKAAVRIFITAQEIIVDNASYPIKEIAENSHIFRTLGLGYANLGALIMSYGLGYDTDEGRALAGAITAIMTGHAYEQIARRWRRRWGRSPATTTRAASGVEKTVDDDQRALHARSHRAAPLARREDPGERPLRLPQGRGAEAAGTTRSRSAKSTATATRRSPCSRRPARSASSWIATPPASSPTSRW